MIINRNTIIVTYLLTNYMKIAEVQRPMTGEWKIEINGRGKYMVAVKVFPK